MRLITIGLAAAVTLGGCSASGDGWEEPSGCQSYDRSGTYLITVAIISGDCVTSMSAVVDRGDPQGRLDADCIVNQPDRWSDDGCTLERAYTCPRDSDGARVATIQAITQKSEGNFVSTETVTLTATDGTRICQGTVRTTYTRQ